MNMEMAHGLCTFPDSSDLDSQREITIEHILSIWPILHSLATSLSAGDLISLSRTSRSVRWIMHGFEEQYNISLPRLPLNLGHHQTSQWSALKSAASFTCVSLTHKEPKSISSSSDHSRKSQQPIRPCNFCSRPICRTCIVRSFFADPTQSRNTFRHRTRHLCTTCWDKGNLRKDHRYPLHASTSSREHIWHGQNYALRGQRCTCSASEDNWLCHSCRILLNESGPLNLSFFDLNHESTVKGEQHIRNEAKISSIPALSNSTLNDIPCYGSDCKTIIGASDSSRDRRRICLWCSRPLPRPFGGEDRLRWEEKQVSIRAVHAAARSADIGEWARSRFRSLTMSRREMRGPDTCAALGGNEESHDARIFVRHLDAVNYRALIGELACPMPEDVYKSKHGYWRYKMIFLGCNAFWRRKGARLKGGTITAADMEPELPAGVTADDLFAVTSEGALPLARRNRDIGPGRGHHLSRFRPPYIEDPEIALKRLAAQLHNANLMTKDEFENLGAHKYRLARQRDWVDLLNRMYDQLMAFELTDECDSAVRIAGESFGSVMLEHGAIIMRGDKETQSTVRTLPTTASDEGEGQFKSRGEADSVTEGTNGVVEMEEATESQVVPANSNDWTPLVPDCDPPPFQT